MPLTYRKLKCYSDFNKPWITPGIGKSVHHKNSLYRACFKHTGRSQSSLSKYKTYKNKLISIIRAVEKLFYKTKFDLTKDNIKTLGN